MKKETVLLVTIVLIVGLLVGILISKGGRDPAPAQVAAPQAPSVNFQQQISMLQNIVEKEPSNRNAWVRLGHAYFDSNQPVKAVEAYDRALELDPNDPDVLTDQGIMFLRLDWYDRALGNFKKAHEVDPSHMQSLFNIGVVNRYYLQDYDAAREAWTRYLEINPSGKDAERARAELESLQAPPGPSQGR